MSIPAHTFTTQHLSSLPHRRACVTAAMLAAIRRIREQTPTHPRDPRTKNMSLDGLDLASVLVLGGVLGELVVRGSAEPHHIVGDVGVGGGGGMPFDISVVDAFLEMASALLAPVALELQNLLLLPQSPDPPSPVRDLGSGVDGCVGAPEHVARTRIVKALWELLGIAPVRDLVGAKVSVFGFLVCFAESHMGWL